MGVFTVREQTHQAMSSCIRNLQAIPCRVGSASVACGSVKCLPMAKTVIRVMFDDATAAEGFLERCRGEGLDAVVEDARPIGTVKRNGPGLASWLKAHPGWHVVAESVNRRAA